MKTLFECTPCFINQALKVSKFLELDDKKTEKMIKKILKYLIKADYNLSPPEIAKEVYKIISKISKNKDPYKDLKKFYNLEILKMEEDLKTIVKDDYLKNLKLAIIGNIIDFGTNVDINKDFIFEQINKFDEKKLVIDDSKKLYNKLKKSNTLLYLADNCGEIIFDKIFIEFLQKELPNLKIYLSFRGGAVINDATIDDISYIDFHKKIKIIDNGDNAPGTVLKNTNKKFQKIFKESDVIISKGQGNFESLNKLDKENIYFLFMAKCQAVADEMTVNKMSLVCKKI